MRYFRIMLIALLMVFLISGGASAANIYKDTYTTEDSSGNWTMAGNMAVTGTMTVTGNTTLSGTVSGKVPTTVISATADTVSTVTAAKSGYTFILATDKTDAGPWQLGLPTAAAGLTYTFCSATNSTMSVKPASTVDTIIYLGLDDKVARPNQSSADKITSPAASGSSVTLVGATGYWYVSQMTGTWTDDGA